MARHLHSIHHVAFEGPGVLAEWAALRGFRHQFTWQHRGDPLPALEEVDLLVVTGGPMSVQDETEHPWLIPEKALLREALRRGIPTLGICLGAQLLAEVLGARVNSMGRKEIGWFPLRRCPESRGIRWLDSLPDPLLALHWHGDQFEIPAGATRLWESEICPHQGFLLGSALALQFHLELDRPALATLVENARHELEPAAPGVQSEAALLDPNAPFAHCRDLCFRLLDAWFDRF